MVGEFVKEWGSIKHASESLNISKSSISSNLKKDINLQEDIFGNIKIYFDI